MSIEEIKTLIPIEPQPFFCNGAYQWEVNHYQDNPENHCYDDESFFEYLQKNSPYKNAKVEYMHEKWVWVVEFERIEH